MSIRDCLVSGFSDPYFGNILAETLRLFTIENIHFPEDVTLRLLCFLGVEPINFFRENALSFAYPIIIIAEAKQKRD